MSQQVSQDKSANENLMKEASYTPNIEMIGENSGKSIALFPGKFKPPHRGHYELLKKIAKKSDEVVVMISPSSKPEVSPEQSLEIWKKYLEASDAPKNVSVEIRCSRASPILLLAINF